MKYCMKCGNPVQETELFCPQCGAALYKRKHTGLFAVMLVAVTILFGKTLISHNSDIGRQPILSLFSQDTITGSMDTLSAQRLVNQIKNCYFDAYSRTLSFGDAIDRGARNVVWDCTERSDGATVVSITGEYARESGGQFTITLQTDPTQTNVYVTADGLFAELSELANFAVLSTLYDLAG